MKFLKFILLVISVMSGLILRPLVHNVVFSSSLPSGHGDGNRARSVFKRRPTRAGNTHFPFILSPRETSP